MKNCSKCGLAKPSGYFYFNSKSKSRLSSWCKLCTAILWAKSRKPYAPMKQDKKERIKHKLKAQQILNRHVQRGLIVRPENCSSCGKFCVTEGHHFDYSKPLDVIWLCRHCHKQKHSPN